jgi:FAD/FMN-containing dehydrogenase
LEDREGVRVFLGGMDREVDGYIAAIDGEASAGLQWPEAPPGDHQLVMRVPPSHVSEGVGAIREALPGAGFVAAHGVGEIRIGTSEVAIDSATELRTFAEKHGGSLVVADAPDDFRAGFDPWGSAPATLDLQRRVKAAFDPLGVCNPGRLPGRL